MDTEYVAKRAYRSSHFIGDVRRKVSLFTVQPTVVRAYGLPLSECRNMIMSCLSWASSAACATKFARARRWPGRVYRLGGFIHKITEWRSAGDQVSYIGLERFADVYVHLIDELLHMEYHDADGGDAAQCVERAINTP